MKKLLITLLFFSFVLSFVLLFITAPKAYAITQTSGDLEVTYESPLFPLSTIWYPGLSLTKFFTVKNLGSPLQTVSIEAINTSQTGDVAEVFLVKIMEGATARYGGSNDKTMKNFWDAGQFNLSDLFGGGATAYDMTITMKSSAGNPYQGKEAKFDLNIGFLGTTAQVTVSGGAAGGGGGGTGDGGSDGLSGKAPVCTDSKPGSAPTLLTAVAGTNSVTLTWSAASIPVTYYLVTYGTGPGLQQFGNPNVGGLGTTSYTVSGLSGESTYYFKVRAGNGCMPGNYSNELSATPGGGFVEGPATGFIPGVLGTTTENTPTPAPTPENVLGTQGLMQQPWWFFLGGFVGTIMQWLKNIFKF